MRKSKLCLLVIIIFLTTIPDYILAQTSNDNKGNITLKGISDSTNRKKQSENILRTVNDLKSGNWQDVLSSFMQLSISDLTGDNKALNFKANLFVLKVKADSNLLIDSNYIKQRFSRNFQFDFSLKLDSQYTFKGFQAGFTWAIINKRDSTVISFANTPVDAYFSRAQGELQNAAIRFRESLLINGDLPGDKVSLVKDVNEKINNMLEENGFVKTSLFPKEFQPFLGQEYDDHLSKADSFFNIELEKLRLKPLLALTINSAFQNKEKAFSNATAQIVYLKGIKSKRSKTELDIRSNLTVKDTLVIQNERRTEFKSTAGINLSLLQSKTGKSIIEFKPYFEYNSILTKPYITEKRDNFLANAELRLRILDNLWLPLSIKYDINNGKFLGFLDIAFNFNAFKSQK